MPNTTNTEIETKLILLLLELETISNLDNTLHRIIGVKQFIPEMRDPKGEFSQCFNTFHSHVMQAHAERRTAILNMVTSDTGII